MITRPEHIAGVTTHTRRGALRNAFRYGVDYVLIDPEAPSPTPALFSRNRFNLASVHDRDHGGPMARGCGVAWLRGVLARNGLPPEGLRIALLTQPRFLGYGFNPVSFWLIWRDAALVAVVAEVSTPFGDRHSYLCHQPGFAPITGDTRIDAAQGAACLALSGDRRAATVSASTSGTTRSPSRSTSATAPRGWWRPCPAPARP